MPSTLALLSCLLLSLTWPARVKSMGAARLAELRKSTVEVFQHGFNNYMQHAFPEDELRPVSCTPLSRDPANPGNYDLNDVLGNYSLTLLDSLSTLAILAGTPSDDQTAEWALKEFQGGVEKFVHYYGDGRRGPSGQGIRARGFDLDSKVQVFETVIRGVGGLLSAHLFAVGELPIPGYDPEHAGLNDDDDDDSDPLELAPIPWPSGFHYDGQLLRLALDMAERLLPAFYTTTGLPYPRVNLRHGIPFYINSPLHKVSPNDPDSTQKYPEKTDTCAAGAGSLVLEFTVLSRLTGIGWWPGRPEFIESTYYLYRATGDPWYLHPTLVIEFPSTNQQGSALNQLFANTAAFKTLYGAKITSLNGLKITFIKEESFAPNYDHTWRVTHVNHIALGKDEIVHIDGDMLSDVKDPLFNRVRYSPYVDLMIVYGEPPSENTTAEAPLETVEVALDEHGNEIHLSEEASSWLEHDAEAPDSLDPSYGSMLKSLVRAVTSVFDPANTPSPDDGPAGASRRTLHMETYKAALPVGIGAVPLPDVRDAPLAPATAPDGNTPAAQLHLPWHTAYLAGQGCTARLPDAIPRNHHVIALRRGGCSFSAKLANIPAVTPTAHSLRLVVVVSDPHEDGLGDDVDDDDAVYGGHVDRPPWDAAHDIAKPHLEDEQRTPGGMLRHRPLSLVMIRGGQTAWEQLGRARGVGVRRKYVIETQGRRVDNIIVL
ncbi:hypothetical protein BN1708_005459, partial [Verticillium longisporum]